jgi:hypothetical protein
MASDVHLVTAPIRWAWEYVKFVIGFSLTILLLPIVLGVLAIHRMVTGQAVFVDGFTMAIPAIYYVLGPLMTMIVYCVLTYKFGKGYRGIHPAYIFFLTVVFVIVSPFIGFWHVAFWAHGGKVAFISTETGFTLLVMFVSSPILLALYRGPQTKKGVLWGTTIAASILAYFFVFFFSVFGILMNM